MFLVGETWEERKAKILSFAEQDCCVGVILATINMEWCLRRCILAMGDNTSTDLVDELAKVSGIKKYQKLWRLQVEKTTGQKLELLMENYLHSAANWKNRKSKLAEEKGFDLSTGWGVLCYAVQLRNKLVHGEKGTASVDFANQTIDLLLEAADVLVRFAESQGAPILGKQICRRKCFIPKVVKA